MKIIYKLSSLGLGCLLAANAYAVDSLCFVAGALGGGTHLDASVVPELARKNIPMRFFSGGQFGSVEARAAKVADLLSEALREDPDLKCHFMGHSMGGLIVRYATNHLSLRHPQLGKIPFRRLALSSTSLAAPHLGTPLASIVSGAQKALFPLEIRSGLEQLSESGVKRFNSPSSPQYSPALRDVPAFSYLGFLRSASEASMFLEDLGYRLLKLNLRLRGKDYRNDGLVPTEAQGFGKVLATLHVPHMFFSREVPEGWPSQTAFYEMHWHKMHGSLPQLLATSSEAHEWLDLMSDNAQLLAE